MSLGIGMIGIFDRRVSVRFVGFLWVRYLGMDVLGVLGYG